MSTSTKKTPAYETVVDWQGVTIRVADGTEFAATSVELRDGGWHEDGDCTPCGLTHTSELLGDPAEILKVWHDEESGHSGPFKFCYEAPCKSLSEALQEWGG